MNSVEDKEKDKEVSNADLVKFLHNNNINFNDLTYYQIALTHKTYSQIRVGIENYETLEFLGDSLISFIVSDYCLKNYPNLEPGELTRLRSKIVDTESFSQIAQELKMPYLLKTGPNKMRTEVMKSKNVHADIFESLIAAIYLDLGLEAAKKFVSVTLFPKIDKIHKEKNKDAKSQLQEYFQSLSKENIYYETIQLEDKTFFSKAIQESKTYGSGKGKSKKEAEKKAACDALKKLKI